MVGRLFALLVLLCGVAGLSRVAAAQAGATIYYTPNQAQPASPQAVTPTFPLPVTPGSGGFPVTPAATTPLAASGQYNFAVTTAQSLPNIPGTATVANVVCQLQSVNYTTSGTAPTTSTGMGPYGPGTPFTLYGAQLAAFKVISTSSGGTCSVEYFH